MPTKGSGSYADFTVHKECDMNRIIKSIPLILLAYSTIVSFANTNTTDKPLQSNVSNQTQAIEKDQLIDDHLYEFNYTLDFTREQGFRDIVALIEDEKYTDALQALEEKTGAGFPWSTEATNGYQYGFFTEALKGICLEKMGEVVKAYRAYQNARYYCNEEKVSILGTPFSAPKLEVYVGIGRMCNEAGRWNDSINYLDTARMEAAEYPTIAVASDKALIKRTVEIGDYKEAKILYKDMEIFTPLTREEYRENAKLNFQTYDDAGGFRVLLKGIALYGIDESKGLKYPMIDIFLENIQRANNADITLFYELLGNALLNARAYSGDEEYIASLINLRFLMCQVFNYLEEENDLEKAEKSIEKAKKRFSAQQSSIVYKKKSNRNILVYKKAKDSENIPHEECNYLEDIVMAADVELCKKNYNDARANYLKALTNNADELDQVEYDGYLIKESIYYGLTVTETTHTQILQNILEAVKEQSNPHVITSVGKLMVNNLRKVPLEDYSKSLVELLPSNNVVAIRILEKNAKVQFEAGNFKEYTKIFKKIKSRIAGVNPDMFFRVGLINARNNNRQAFTEWVNGLQYSNIDLHLLRYCYRTLGWGEIDDVIRFFKIKSLIPIHSFYRNVAVDVNNSLSMNNKDYDYEDVTNLYKDIEEYKTNVLCHKLSMIKLNGFAEMTGDSFIRNGMTNYAFEFYNTSLNHKYGLLNIYKQLCKDILSWPENKKISIMVNGCSSANKLRYTLWTNLITNEIKKTN